VTEDAVGQDAVGQDAVGQDAVGQDAVGKDAVADLLSGARWTCAAVEPGSLLDPRDLAAAVLGWLPAHVPGTAGAALRAAGTPERGADPDAVDWWFRTTLPAHVPTEPGWLLRAQGIATLAEVWLDNRLVLRTESAFVAEEAELAEVRPGAVLAVRCAALAPLLAQRRRPRARWRSPLVRAQELRWWRTPLLGRSGDGPSTMPVVGPWRPLTLVPRMPLLVRAQRVWTRIEGDAGVLAVRLLLEGPLACGAPVALRLGGERAVARLLPVEQGVEVTAELRVPHPQRWWPHTHGRPILHEAWLEAGDERVPLGRVGFRTIEADRGGGGFALVVNGTPVFARGAGWGPLDPVLLSVPRATLRAALQQACEAGMNMVRVAGTGAYEDEDFWCLCDELGLLVWQDAMTATLDVPDEPVLLTLVERELRQLVTKAVAHPSLAVLCGGSETEQQPILLGLDPGLAEDAPVARVLAAVAAELAPDVAVLSSSPSGGPAALRADVGVSHWFGVGAYLRPLAAARLEGVRFASECLAFSVPPERSTVEQACGGPQRAGHHPAWKRAVPRDPSASWDFEDVTAHYVRLLYGVEPAAVRRNDPERALDLARAAAAEAVGTTLATWRRPGSGCAGALVLTLRDSIPGAGWGLVDALGRPKATWYAARRVLAPVTVLVTDEGTSGLRLHVLNDRPEPLAATVGVELLAHGERRVDDGERAIVVPGHAAMSLDAEEILGAFRDVGRAYGFGPPAHDAVVVSLRGQDGTLLAQAVHLPGGPARPVDANLGLSGRLMATGGGWGVQVRTQRLAVGVVAEVEGFLVEDAWFALPPGEDRFLALRPDPAGPALPGPRGEVRALNGLASRLEAAP